MIGVVGVDIPITALESFLYQSIPDCVSGRWSCALFDHSGYLLTSVPSLNGSTPEHEHVSQRYPDEFSDIINRHSIAQVPNQLSET